MRIATVDGVTPTVLRHELLEDERRWALLFGAVALVTAVLVSTYDVDDDSTARLLTVSLLPVAFYGAKAWVAAVPAWLIVLATGLAQAGAAVVDSDAEGHAFLMLSALFFMFFREPRRGLAMAIAVVAAPLPLILTVIGVLDDAGWLYWTMGNLICIWFGVLAHDLRLIVSELHRQRAEAIDQAISSERQRIARDVHDLVGHSLSVMMLHLTAARRTITEQPEQSVAALSQAEGIGREAMAEIRGTIGMLSDDGAGHHDADHPGGVNAPVPGIGDLSGLVGQYRDAGLDVVLTVDGDQASLDGARSVAAYRIVQEALVNASKHTTGAEVAVNAHQTDAGWTIQVINRGGSTRTASRRAALGETAPSQARTAADVSPPASSGGGLGLVGMRERARSVNGHLDVGPTADGWRVEVSLPSEVA